MNQYEVSYQILTLDSDGWTEKTRFFAQNDAVVKKIASRIAFKRKKGIICKGGVAEIRAIAVRQINETISEPL